MYIYHLLIGTTGLNSLVGYNSLLGGLSGGVGGSIPGGGGTLSLLTGQTGTSLSVHIPELNFFGTQITVPLTGSVILDNAGNTWYGVGLGLPVH